MSRVPPAPVVVEETAPNPPLASADRAPDFASAGGPVTLGQEGSCAPNSFFSVVTPKANTAAVTVQGEGLADPNVFHGSLKVLSNTGGTTVSGNEIASSLTVKGNAAPVIDTPNVVEGKSKVQ